MKGICIGLGVRGRWWTRFAAEAGIEVVGVVDPVEETRHAAAKEMQIPESIQFPSVAEAVAATRAEVATVCTPNPTHAAVIHECLDVGLHTLVEKPMVESPEDAASVMEKAKSKCLHLAVAQNYRYTPMAQALWSAVKGGRVGRVATVQIVFSRWRPARGLYLPLMLNQAIHQFDMVRLVLQTDPTWCFARSWNPTWSPTDGPCVLEAMWGMGHVSGNSDEPEMIFSFSGNYVTAGTQTPYNGQWRIEGERGRIETVGNDEGQRAFLQHRETNETIELPLGKGDGSEAQVCRAFLEAIREGRPAPTESTDNIRSLAMCWAADRSSREHRVVPMNEYF